MKEKSNTKAAQKRGRCFKNAYTLALKWDEIHENMRIKHQSFRAGMPKLFLTVKITATLRGCWDRAMTVQKGVSMT